MVHKNSASNAHALYCSTSHQWACNLKATQIILLGGWEIKTAAWCRWMFPVYLGFILRLRDDAWMNGGLATRITDLSAWWRWEFSFTLRQSYRQRKHRLGPRTNCALCRWEEYREMWGIELLLAGRLSHCRHWPGWAVLKAYKRRTELSWHKSLARGLMFCRLLSCMSVNKHQQTHGADITERNNLAAL